MTILPHRLLHTLLYLILLLEYYIPALVSEIKDLKEKSQKESNIPHLEYEYLDRSIHEELFKLVQFSCEEIWSNKEKMGKVLRLWNNLLELMLGLKNKHQGASTTSKEASNVVTTRVFYVNDDFYVLFRLHRVGSLNSFLLILRSSQIEASEFIV